MLKRLQKKSICHLRTNWEVFSSEQKNYFLTGYTGKLRLLDILAGILHHWSRSRRGHTSRPSLVRVHSCEKHRQIPHLTHQVCYRYPQWRRVAWPDLCRCWVDNVMSSFFKSQPRMKLTKIKFIAFLPNPVILGSRKSFLSVVDT